MARPSSRRGIQIAKVVSNTVASLVAMCGLVVLGAWTFLVSESEPNPKVDFIVRLNPLVAVMFVLLAFAFKVKALKAIPKLNGLANLIGLLSIVIGSLKLISLAIALPFTIDQLLFPSRFTSDGTYHLNVMHPVAAVCLVSVGLVIILMNAKKLSVVKLTQGISYGLICISMVVMVRFAYGAMAIYNTSQATSQNIVPWHRFLECPP